MPRSLAFTFDLAEQDLSFEYAEDAMLPDAYERVLYDAIHGDQTLFASTDEVTAQWNIITPILEYWQSGDAEDGTAQLETHPQGELPPCATEGDDHSAS